MRSSPTLGMLSKKRAAGPHGLAAQPFLIYYYEHGLFEKELGLFAVAVILTAEVGIVDLAKELGNLLVRPVPCFATDGGGFFAEINPHGTATTLVGAEVVLQVVWQQRARPAEVLTVFVVEEQYLVMSAREDNGLFHKAQKLMVS